MDATLQNALTNPKQVYAQMMRWIEINKKDFMKHKASFVDGISFISWLGVKGYISPEKANELLNWALPIPAHANVNALLTSSKLFPVTFAKHGLGRCKAYALLAEYISEFEIYRNLFIRTVGEGTVRDNLNALTTSTLPVALNSIASEDDVQKLDYQQQYTLVSGINIHKCDNFFYRMRTAKGIMIGAPHHLKNSFMSFCVLMNYWNQQKGDLSKLDIGIPDGSRAFIAWLLAKGHISHETADKFLSSFTSFWSIDGILNSKVLFTVTQSRDGLRQAKACALLAEFISEYDICRFKLYNLAAYSEPHKAPNPLREIAHEQLRQICISKNQVQEAGNTSGLNYFQLYTLVSSMSIEECDSFFRCDNATT